MIFFGFVFCEFNDSFYFRVYIEANQHIAHFKRGIVHIFVWFSIFYSEWVQWTIWNINEYTRFTLAKKQWRKVTGIFFFSF